MNNPYFIEVYEDGCPTCSDGRAWGVVGPDGIHEGYAYDNMFDADEAAEALNGAFEAGRRSAQPAVAAERLVIEAADQWEADQGDCVDYEIALATAIRSLREARKAC